MADSQARRIITRQPEARDNERWHGHLEAVGRPTISRWRHATIEDAVKAMNKDLGELPDDAYDVRES